LKKLSVILAFLALLGAPMAHAADLGQDPLLAVQPGQPLLLAAADSLSQNKVSQNIGDEEISSKEPYVATIFSILPGIVFHGSGNFYGGDTQFGTEMLVMEIIGGGLSIWAYNVIHSPQNWGPYFGNEQPQAGYWLMAGGVGLLTISWVGDVATAPGAAENWNKDHQLEFQMDSFNGHGARLTLATTF